MSKFLESVSKECISSNQFRWYHKKTGTFRDILISKCMYCEKENVPCYDSQIFNMTNSTFFHACQDCMNEMFDQSVYTQADKISTLQKEKSKRMKQLADIEKANNEKEANKVIAKAERRERKQMQKAKEKAYRKEQKLREQALVKQLKAECETIEKELASLV